MIQYEDSVKKDLKKGALSALILRQFHNAFLSIDLTHDFSLFDIKRLKGRNQREYYRLRKGKYRAIFYLEVADIRVVIIAKREEVYDLWE